MVKVNLERLQMATNGEVETIELMNGEFVNSDMHKVRAYQLHNGMVFSFKGTHFEFEDDILYEVESDGYEYDEHGIQMYSKWKRTDESCLISQFNEKYNKQENYSPHENMNLNL